MEVEKAIARELGGCCVTASTKGTADAKVLGAVEVMFQRRACGARGEAASVHAWFSSNWEKIGAVSEPSALT
jgi:hypothetical protein